MSKMLIDDIINQFRILFDKDIEPGEEGEKVFEKLIAYLMTCKYASDYNFDIQDICSGQSKGTPGSERSIDSAAVIIDGIVVPNVEYLEEKYKDFGNMMEVSYVFTQSKYSDKYSDILGNHSKFISGVCSILESEKLPEGVTPSLRNFAEIKNVIESGKINIDGKVKKLPFGKNINVYTCYAVAASEKNKNDSLEGAKEQIAQNIRNLEKVGEYSVHDTLFAGSETIRSIYEDIFIGSTAEFYKGTLKSFEESNNISRHGINKIYTGYLSLGEYLNIIHDESGNLKGGIFSENVRGYLDTANINKSIKDSLRNGRNQGNTKTEEDRRIGRDLFFAMNNGITIIAKNLEEPKGSATLMRIRGYQIVNGCQTSHILHEYYTELKNKLKDLQKKVPIEYLDKDETGIMKSIYKAMKSGENLGEDWIENLTSNIENLKEHQAFIKDVESSICIPIRIIHTQNDDVIDMIISSTNTQNPVNDLVLSSRSSFNKELEYYFKNKNQGVLVYERRKNQYLNSIGSFKHKIGVVELMKSFASIYLNRPHDSARYYGKLSKLATRDNPGIFSEIHNCESYYLAARIYVDLDDWLRNQKILTEYKRNRWHLMYAVSRIIQRDLYSKKNISIMEDVTNHGNLRKMKNLLEVYLKEFENGFTDLEEVFCESKDVIDEAIETIHNAGVERNEINKSPDFAKQIDAILAR